PDDKTGGPDETTGDPATGKARDRTLFASPQDEAKEIVADATRDNKSEPVKALEALNDMYARASPDVKKAILADPGTKALLNDAAKSLNLAFDPGKGGQFDAARRGVAGLNKLSQKLKPELAGALAEKVFQGHQKEYAAIKNGGAYTGSDASV